MKLRIVAAQSISIEITYSTARDSATLRLWERVFFLEEVNS